MIRIAAYLNKGGTGKTTTVAHFAAALAESGMDVLAMDLAGKQGDLSKIFGVWEEWSKSIREGDGDWPNISTVFQPEWPQIASRMEDRGVDPIQELIHKTEEGVDLIPAHTGLDGLDVRLESQFSGTEKYRRLDQFHTQYLDDRYDIVLMDLPGISNNITYNGVWATKNLLVPVKPGKLEAQQANALQDDIGEFREVGRDVQLTMLLPNMVNEKTKLGRRYMRAWAEEYPDTIAPVPIRESQDIPNQTDQGRTIFAAKEYELLESAQQAKQQYIQNANELVSRLMEETNGR